MRDDYAAQFLVGASTAAASAVLNLAMTGQVNWLWVTVAFAVPFEKGEVAEKLETLTIVLPK